jgi:signal peptidase I
MKGFRRRRLSFTEQKMKTRRFLRNLIALLLVLSAYSALKGFFLAPYRIGSSSMAPGLLGGDRIIVSPLVFGPLNPFTGRALPGFREARRGELVLVDHPAMKRPGGLGMLVDGVLRFFTFQLIGIGGRDGEEPVVKRVIAVGGDSVSIKGFKASVKPAGEKRFLSEDEMSAKPYDIIIPTLPEGWNGDLPFSGDMAQIELGPGQYFLLSDDRSFYHDSRSWGPVAGASLRALVLGRYWPFGKR